ncbi:MAG: EAL domain-containing protein [Dechloromonas sp.]|nr:MAG: EAL domain-containing protein [Dechloromonas sp.]
MPPAQFIAIAEESGLIDEIGDWVIATVCRQLRTWLDDGIRPPRVAINLSTRQLRQHNLAMGVARRLIEAAVAPDLLEFEITETAAMENADTAGLRLGELSAMGSPSASTISAQVIRRCCICAVCRSTRSRSTILSCGTSPATPTIWRLPAAPSHWRTAWACGWWRRASKPWSNGSCCANTAAMKCKAS